MKMIALRGACHQACSVPVLRRVTAPHCALGAGDLPGIYSTGQAHAPAIDACDNY